MSDSLQKPKLSRKFKVVLWVAGLAAAYAVTGFFIVPAVVKSQMVKRLPALTHRQAAVRQVSFNPFMFSFAMRGLSLTESNGDVFAGLDAFHLQFQALASLTRRAWVFRDVTVTHPFAHVIRRKDGTFNFDNLMDTNAAAAAKPGPPAALPAVVVESLRIDGASLEADDLTAPFHDKVAPVDLQLTDFSTLSNAASAFAFSAVTDAEEKFAASGKITVQPLQVSGNVKVTGLDLKRYEAYLAPFTRAEVAGGKLDAGADYQLAAGPNGPDATVTHGTAALAGLRVTSPDSGETVVSIPTLNVLLDEASLGRKTAHVRSIKSSGGSLLVRQNKDGGINLLALLVTNAPPAAAPTPEPAAAGAPWTAQVDEVAFGDYGLTIEDQKPAHPAKIEVSGLAFSVKGFNSATHSPLATDLSLRLNGQGSLSVRGTVSPEPPSADLTIELAGLDLPPFAPYLPEQIKLVLSKGQLNVKGRAQCALASNGPAGSFAGDVALKDFAAADPIHDRDLVKFEALTVKGIQASYPAVKLHIEEVALKGLSANAVIDTNGRINLLTVVTTNAPSATAASASAAGPAPQIDLGALVIEKASFHYVDESIEPHATFDLQELSGTVQGISSQPQGPAKVDFRGNVDSFSPFSISGSVNPLTKDITLNLAVNFKNVELISMSPYMEKFGGYPLNKGKLMLELDYDVAQRKLAATNKVVIADLTLGQRNGSTNATHLPVKLGVALLKDRQGKIDLDVPLSGSLDDPEFKVIPLVWKVVGNLLAKAATSPFTLLGKALGGGGGEELSSADFAPGEAVLTPPEKAKVEKLAKALYERPALTLQIAGSCAPGADGAVLARRHLRRRINKLRAEEQAAAGQPVESVESITLDPADYGRLLEKLYVQTFGPIGTNQAAFPSSNPAAAAPSLEKTAELAQTPSSSHPRFVNSKGGEQLMRHEAARHPAPMAAAAKPAATAKTGSATAASAPSGPDLAQMEERLAGEIKVTDDELRELEQARAQAVRSALLESGQIPAERIFILAPKPIQTAAQGETRANFSLE